MVRKNGKHGVRSGNTLRASNTRYNKQYHSDSCIVRKSSNLSRRQSNQVADDALLDSDGVLYSLNKKGRWALPKMIKDNIHDEEDIKVSIYHRHKLSRDSDCVEYSCNKGDLKTCVAKHGYFNGASVNSERKGKGSRKKKRQTQSGQSTVREGDEEPISDPDPEITYDVYYPSPKTSSISHNPKYIRNAELIVYDDGDIREVGRVRKKRGGRHRVNVVSDGPYSDGEMFESFDDRESENEESAPEDEVKSPEVLLIDILESAEKAQQLCSEQPKKRRVKKKKPKTNLNEEDWVFVSENIDEDEAYNTTEEESVSSDTPVRRVLVPTPKLQPVRIILESNCLHPQQLQEKFQDRYIEANCEPRKFIVDTTHAVTEAMKKSKIANMLFVGSLDFSSCLVFSRDASYDEGLDVYSVHFNINCSVDVIRIESLYDLMPSTIDDVIQAAASYATVLPPQNFEKREMAEVAVRDKKFMCITFVPSVNKWNTQSIPLQDVPEEEEEDYEMISNKEVSGAAAASAEFKDESTRPDYCNICFEEINPELLSSAPASCLRSCGHWFCDGCWREHVSERIHSGSTQLMCPEYRCTSVIDHGTILSISNIKLVKLHQKLKLTTDVESSPNMKWCPNPKCGRVLKKQDMDQESVTVNCECGKVVCFCCLGDAHWPATCEQKTQYTQKLRKKGDDDQIGSDGSTTFVVWGKNCPNCNRHIVKNGGCKYMLCVCGSSFCWACLGKWADHKDYASCQRKSDEFRTKQTIVKHVDTAQKDPESKMYMIAVENRNQRKPQNVRSLKAKMNSLSVQFRSLMSKGVDIGQENLEAGSSVHEFLVQMLQLKLELNHVIEHTAVFLDGRHIRTGSRKLVHACERFHGISKSIEDLLNSKGRQESVKAIGRLCYLRNLAKRGVVALVTLLGKLESAENVTEE